jgi:phage terminase large subunit
MKVTKSYFHVRQSNKRFVIQQGGARSGKTYNTLLALIDIAASNVNAGAVFTICRKTSPALTGSVYRDFLNILQENNIYSEANHNKTSREYNLFGNLFEFISVDEPQKMRGRKRNVTFINEANELTFEDFQQLNIRTEDKLIIDFNPSHLFWAITEIKEKRPDECDYFITTYKDNPFLNADLKRELEALEQISYSHYLIYTLGQFAPSDDLIFNKFDTIAEVPEAAQLLGYGLDFGFASDPAACVALYKYNKGIIVDEIAYVRAHTNSDLAEILRNPIKHDIIVADSAEPKSIEDFRRFGFNVIGAAKGQDSVRSSIDLVKQYPMSVTNRSTNLLRELRGYRWRKDREGQIMQPIKPVDKDNHAIDALRYVAQAMLRGYGNYSIS